MGVFHFLNVRNGDCSIIQHPSGRVTVIDVFNASLASAEMQKLAKALREALPGNFNQKDYPENPIEYLSSIGVAKIFRFVLTHPDMDHMGGIKDLFKVFSPVNFWDTDNTSEKDFGSSTQYNEEDWLFYKNLRDTTPQGNPKRIALYAGSEGQYYNVDESGNSGGDGLQVLAPTPELMSEANRTQDFNDASYVVLYKSHGGRIIVAGDSHDKTWEYILSHHADKVRNVDVLVAPHHGRDSDRTYDFLDIVNPTLTLFGNAPSRHLAYGAWSRRKLEYITNNQVGTVVVDTNSLPMRLYVTNKAFAERFGPLSYSREFGAYYLCEITR